MRVRTEICRQAVSTNSDDTGTTGILVKNRGKKFIFNMPERRST